MTNLDIAIKLVKCAMRGEFAEHEVGEKGVAVVRHLIAVIATWEDIIVTTRYCKNRNIMTVYVVATTRKA